MISKASPSIDPIREKVEAGERLTAAEAESLWDEANSPTSSGSGKTATRATTTSTPTSIRPTSASTAAPSVPSGPTCGRNAAIG